VLSVAENGPARSKGVTYASLSYPLAPLLVSGGTSARRCSWFVSSRLAEVRAFQESPKRLEVIGDRGIPDSNLLSELAYELRLNEAAHRRR
jgi:hypothetical protein